MKTYINSGEVQEFVAPSGGVVSGTPYQIGQAVLIATETVAETVSFSGLIRGRVSVPKVGSQAWTVGALVYFDAGNARFTTVASGSRLAGWATAVVGSGAGETTGEIYLDGAARPDEA